MVWILFWFALIPGAEIKMLYYPTEAACEERVLEIKWQGFGAFCAYGSDKHEEQ